MGSAASRAGARGAAALAEERSALCPAQQDGCRGSQAIWTAGQQPGARFVAVKSVGQQVVLSLHRLRAQLMKIRIMQTNELRGVLYEFGIVLPEGQRVLFKELPAALVLASERWPSMLVESLHEQVSRIDSLEADIAAIERHGARQMKTLQRRSRMVLVPQPGSVVGTDPDAPVCRRLSRTASAQPGHDGLARRRTQL